MLLKGFFLPLLFSGKKYFSRVKKNTFYMFQKFFSGKVDPGESQDLLKKIS